MQESWVDLPGYDSHALFHHHIPETGKKSKTISHGRPDVAFQLIQRTPMSPTDKLRSELISKGRNGQLSARFVVIPEFRMMEHLPRRLGEDPALDYAVKLICTLNQAETMRAYGVALRSLQSSIERGLSSETLGAATLLQMHDFFRNFFYPTWTVHAKGVINMLKARGPHAVTTGFDKCLLQAQVGNITFDALRERTSCFLALPAWNAKVKALSSHEDGAGGEKYSWDLSLIAVGVHIPGLICRFEDMMKEKKSTSVHGYHSMRLLADSMFARDLRRVRSDLEDALRRAPQQAESQDPATNRIRPALLLSANIYLVMMDFMIDEAEGSELNSPMAGEIDTLAPDIKHLSHVLAVDTTRALYDRLYQIDAVALQSTADMMKLTLARVINATDDAGAKTSPTSVTLQETFQMLSSRPGEHDGGLLASLKT